MPHDVFISYSSKDKTTADAACAKLETEGIRCWIAPRDIAPSADWASSIVDAIDECRLMVLIFSAHANHSRQVHREVQRAIEQEKPVVPFRIEDVAPESTLAFYMPSVQWLDALPPPVDQHLQKLSASVVALVQTLPPGDTTLYKSILSHSSPVHSVAFSPDGKLICSRCKDNSINVWNLENGRIVRKIPAPGIFGQLSIVKTAPVAYSPNKKWIATTYRNKKIILWNPGTGRAALSIKEPHVELVAFSPDSSSLVSCMFMAGCGYLHVWHTGTAAILKRLDTRTGVGLKAVAYSPDGRWIGAGGGGGNIFIWDGLGELRHNYRMHEGRIVRCIAFSPNGELILFGGDFNNDFSMVVEIREIATGEQVQELKARSPFSLSPDGKKIASAGPANTVTIWDVEAGQLLNTIRGHSGVVNSVAYSPTGEYLASGSSDGTVRLWKTALL